MADVWTYPSILVGLVGAGIQASRTPALHEREGAAQGLRYIYKLIDLEKFGLDVNSLSDILKAAQHFGFAGLNITHPCKQAIISLLDELSSDAEALGAVNTVVLKEGRRVGHNTDWWGFAESFRRELSDVRRDRVVQFGAGGAGAAVAHALLTLGVGEINVIDTDSSRAENLVDALRRRFGPTRASTGIPIMEAMTAADGMVNTTPLGMARYPGMAVPVDLLRPDLWVSDIVYFPLETELLRQARARGCRTMSGGGMAVFQAVGAFRLFAGREPDAERMLQHFSQM
ncbi:shikimate dehydrogenase [Microvirga calopogonii]|uniref:shikimate dehydrogenase n=1 Tax=Microvirga calopogonii TaxID=2078013 RepID=UPI001FE239C9|nr:shikimate dehydrogenase [Microvirga calopogonii]